MVLSIVEVAKIRQGMSLHHCVRNTPRATRGPGRRKPHARRAWPPVTMQTCNNLPRRTQRSVVGDGDRQKRKSGARTKAWAVTTTTSPRLRDHLGQQFTADAGPEKVEPEGSMGTVPHRFAAPVLLTDVMSVKDMLQSCTATPWTAPSKPAPSRPAAVTSTSINHVLTVSCTTGGAHTTACPANPACLSVHCAYHSQCCPRQRLTSKPRPSGTHRTFQHTNTCTQYTSAVTTSVKSQLQRRWT